jgi:hypothetical protein
VLPDLLLSGLVPPARPGLRPADPPSTTAVGNRPTPLRAFADAGLLTDSEGQPHPTSVGLIQGWPRARGWLNGRNWLNAHPLPAQGSPAALTPAPRVTPSASADSADRRGAAGSDEGGGLPPAERTVVGTRKAQSGGAQQASEGGMTRCVTWCRDRRAHLAAAAFTTAALLVALLALQVGR